MQLFRQFRWISYRVCIVGSGPAGFYTAQSILKESQRRQLPISIDMLERLPTPYGLVRYGVAPDHPEVKQCTEKFEELFKSSALIQWFGGVTIGKDILFEDLCRNYHAVVLAIGAQKERILGIPGESTLSGIYHGRQWLEWVNGYPAQKSPNEPFPLYPDTATVIGNGNVALDVARLLLLTDRTTLSHSDIYSQALDSILAARLQHVHIIGRRGPMDISFTAKELREVMTICHEKKIPIYTNHLEDINSMRPAEHPDRSKRRVLQILKDMGMVQLPGTLASPSLSFLFHLVPKAFVPHKENTTRLGAARFSHGSDSVTLPCSTAFTCVGSNVILPDNIASYFGAHALSHQAGRVTTAPASTNGSARVYVVGWCKTGPKGTLSSTVIDAAETSDTIIQDLAIDSDEVQGREWLLEKLKGLEYITFKDWIEIDRLERRLGEKHAKSREKIIDAEFLFHHTRQSGPKDE